MDSLASRAIWVQRVTVVMVGHWEYVARMALRG